MRLLFRQYMSTDHTTIVDNWILLNRGENELVVVNIPSSNFSICATVTLFYQWVCKMAVCAHE